MGSVVFCRPKWMRILSIASGEPPPGWFCLSPCQKPTWRRRPRRHISGAPPAANNNFSLDGHVCVPRESGDPARPRFLCLNRHAAPTQTHLSVASTRLTRQTKTRLLEQLDLQIFPARVSARRLGATRTGAPPNRSLVARQAAPLATSRHNLALS